MADSTTTHVWGFTRAGGFDQANLDHAKDFAALAGLDQKLWAALACPVKGLELDERTLSLLDTDGDGRIRAPEVIAAIRWVEDHLTSLDPLGKGGDALALSSLRNDTDGAKALAVSANRVLASLGKADAGSVTLDDVTKTAEAFAKARLNGDGVIPAASAQDEEVARAIADIVGCTGGVADRSGELGIDQARLDTFFEQAAAHLAWADRAAAEASSLSPAGDGTAAAAAAIAAVRAKVDDFFGRCRLAAFDERALAAVNRKEDEYLALAAQDLSITASEIAGFPLARVEPGRDLPLVDGVNPAWASALETLRTAAVGPLLGTEQTELSADEWTALKGKVAAYEAYMADRPEGSVEGLGVDRLRELTGGDARAAIAQLIADDAALAPEYAGVEAVERLIRYQRDLRRLVRNFVNLLDFYGKDAKATFQAGTLYLDGRACELVVRVADPGKHAALAGLSKAYLAYCACTRPSGEKMDIAAAFTDGDSDYLMVGRNGIFYDRQGRDWDATITKVVANPISLREAFWAPYKKFVRLLEDMAAKRAAAAEADADKKVAAGAAATGEAAGGKPPETKKIDVGTVAALGVAVGAIGGFLTAAMTGIVNLAAMPFWIICLVVLGVVLLISTPSMAVAWLKLRQRNLAPILDANGWAVNGRVKLSVRFGKTLTSVAKLPAGARRGGSDPNEDRPSPWPKLLLFIVILGFVYSVLNEFGLIHEWTNGALGRDLAAEKAEKDAQAAEDAAKKAAEEADQTK